MATLRLGDIAPDFKQDSTLGTIRFHEWLGNNWGVLFSHPKDFTPVCTTELGYTAKLKAEFDKRNVKAIAVSVDPLESHKSWIEDIDETQNTKREFSDPGRRRPQGREPLRHDPPERERHADRALGFHHRPEQEDPRDASPTRPAPAATSTRSCA